MGTFGTLSRRLPQDPVPTLPSTYPFFRRSQNMEDRRDEQLTDLQRAQILMGLADGQNPKYPAAAIVQPLAGPLSVEAGMLDIVPSHERWLAERIGALPSSMSMTRR